MFSDYEKCITYIKINIKLNEVATICVCSDKYCIMHVPKTEQIHKQSQLDIDILYKAFKTT